MRYRATFLAGFAAGFVAGARAGRERYEQMRRIADRVATHPAVRRAAAAAAGTVTGAARTAGERAGVAMPRIARAARSRGGGRLDGFTRFRGTRHADRAGRAAGVDGQPTVPPPDTPRRSGET